MGIDQSGQTNESLGYSDWLKNEKIPTWLSVHLHADPRREREIFRETERE